MDKTGTTAEELFVWYRCEDIPATVLLTAIRQILDGVATRCGVHGRVLMRQDSAATWMEHYVPRAGVPVETLRLALAESVAEAAAVLRTDGHVMPPRHIEAFACVAEYTMR